MTTANTHPITRPRRLSYWIWIALGVVWMLICAAMLRPDRPATLLARYCVQTGNILSCDSHQDSRLLLPPPNLGVARKELLFFLALSLGTPFLLVVMGRAARWAAGGNTD